jgi:uncharacterized protein
VSIVVASDDCAQRADFAAPPKGKWKWSQHWRDVLFLHWPASCEWLRQRLPRSLEIDTFAGQAWVSLVGFHLEQMRHRLCPPAPFLTGYLELNFRTYVRYRGERAIYFLKMYADRWAIVAAARCLTPLPYTLGSLQHFSSGGERNFRCRTPEHSILSCRFQLQGKTFVTPRASLDEWLVERYVAYVADARGRLYRMPVEHPPWRIQRAELCHCEHAFEESHHGAGELVLSHYSAGVASHLWPLSRVE